MNAARLILAAQLSAQVRSVNGWRRSNGKNVHFKSPFIQRRITSLLPHHNCFFGHLGVAMVSKHD